MPNRPRRSNLEALRAAAPGKSTPRIGDTPEPRRRDIFSALIQALKAGAEPDAARYAVARQFVLTVLKVEAIEDEGRANRWSQD
jgi:hypothetical protein